MSCANATFNGWGECSALLEKMEGLVLQYKGNDWTNDDLISASKWHDAIASITRTERTALPFPVISFENTTDDLEILTTPLGLKFPGTKPTPSGIVYLQCSVEDYQTLVDLEGAGFELFPFFQGGTFWATDGGDGTKSGFRVRVSTKTGLPVDDKLQSFPLYLFFDQQAQFDNVTVVSDYNFDFGTLLDYAPVGLAAEVVTPYSGGDITVKVSTRGTGAPQTGLLATNFEILGASPNTIPPVEVTDPITELGQGQYTLGVMQDTGGTPTALTADQWFQVQVVIDDTTYVTYISKTTKAYGG